MPLVGWIIPYTRPNTAMLNVAEPWLRVLCAGAHGSGRVPTRKRERDEERRSGGGEERRGEEKWRRRGSRNVVDVVLSFR